ncbi:allantoate permease [Candida orthopsilosis Co 90-125]|uniref:Allantoate permease n=1 Tax=Candida orthopsilosis (strain 90-125) TaxID=1136231 RepID=H8XA11_CANO9|nr:allantoate permease [Candida orthopsilosis Co 90-125]CCG24988.1 allantoate permease [Candida orthopsilosis Co 90-125]
MTRQNSSGSITSDEKLKGTKEVITTIETDSSYEANKLAKNPFLDPKVEEFYRDLYTKSRYESYSAFDPTFEWTEEEEKKVIWKLNWRVVFTACLLFVSLQVGRGNLSQAVSDNFLDDLGLNTNDFNVGNTIFTCSFLVCRSSITVDFESFGTGYTIPATVIHIIFLLLITWFSERINERSFVCTIMPIYTIPIMGVIRWWPGAGNEAWPTWVLNTLYLGQPYIHAICVAWVSRNSNSVRNRSICLALYNIFVQLGSIIGSNIYREDDKPLYKRGNMQLFAITFILLPILLLTKAYYMWRNKKR